MSSPKEDKDPKDSKGANLKSSISVNKKSKLEAREQFSVGSRSSIETTVSVVKDPKEFLHSRGYDVGRIIAEGGFAVVYKGKMKRVRDESDDSPEEKAPLKVAIKVFDLTDPSQISWAKSCLRQEMFISKYLKHPNIVQTFEVLKTHTHGYIVMALAPNGSIKHDITDRLKRPYTNEEAKKYFKGLCNGLQYMHSHNIAHRNLKLDNFLLSGDFNPMIGDFGFAARGSGQTEIVLAQILRKSRCGTDGYMAPELYRNVEHSKSSVNVGTSSKSTLAPTESASAKEGFYDAKAVDIYAMGVSLFEMLNLVKPYSKKMDEGTVKKVTNQEITYSNPKIEDACKELISAMIKFTPDARPKVDHVLQHKWITAYSSLFIDIMKEVKTSRAQYLPLSNLRYKLKFINRSQDTYENIQKILCEFLKENLGHIDKKKFHEIEKRLKNYPLEEYICELVIECNLYTDTVLAALDEHLCTIIDVAQSASKFGQNEQEFVENIMMQCAIQAHDAFMLIRKVRINVVKMAKIYHFPVWYNKADKSFPMRTDLLTIYKRILKCQEDFCILSDALREYIKIVELEKPIQQIKLTPIFESKSVELLKDDESSSDSSDGATKDIDTDKTSSTFSTNKKLLSIASMPQLSNEPSPIPTTSNGSSSNADNTTDIANEQNSAESSTSADPKSED